MTITLSTRIAAIKPSPTMAINAKAAELRQQGHDIINLSVGEPDFDTPSFIKQSAIEAIWQGFTKYTAADGTPELKEAIIAKLKKDNQLTYDPTQIIVSSGLKQTIYNALQALLNAGDEVIIPAPYWVSYPDMVLLAGAKPVIVPCKTENRFKLTAEQLEAAITPATRLLLINSPCNPSGQVYSMDELKALGAVLKQHPRVFVISDDIYEYILWGGGSDRYHNILNATPELADRTIVGNGVSKAYAMTGWRIGYAAAAQPIVAAMKKIQSQSTSCPNSIAQKAATTALNANRDFFTPMLEAYERRHHLVWTALNAMNNVDCLPSEGTFYLFPNVTKVMEQLKLSSDVALAELLLERVNVAIVPGTAFGAPGHIRISCATSEDKLQAAMQRIGDVFSAR